MKEYIKPTFEFVELRPEEMCVKTCKDVQHGCDELQGNYRS